MGKVLSVITRKVNRFNVENRALKVISKEKPTPAPMHASEKYHADKMMKDHPEIMEKIRSRDTDLNNRLKHIFVTSEDPVPTLEISKESESKGNLPQDRHTYEDPQFGYYEPLNIPQGRLTLKQAVKIIGDYQTDPQRWTAETVSNKYNLSLKLSENILQYYRSFEMFIPEKKLPEVEGVAPIKDVIKGRLLKDKSKK